MKNSSYLRLKNIQLGYSLPKNLISKLGLNKAMIYVNGQNIFTMTKFWEGYDPEVAYNADVADGVSLGGGNYYPQVKVYSIGLDIKF